MKRFWVWLSLGCAAFSAPDRAVARMAFEAKGGAEPAKFLLVGAPEGPPAPAPAPIYEPQLLRLVEIMGSLSYLAGLCDRRERADYLENAKALIDAQTSPLREKLAGAYNRGYRVVEATYFRCTPNASALVERYVEEGARLSRAIGAVLRDR